MSFPFRLFLLVLAGATLLCGTSSRAQSEYPEWREAFAIYVNDPVAGAGLVVELGRKSTDDLPPAALTVLGDAHLRQGNYGTARKMFLRALEDPVAVSEMGPGKAPIASHAEFGLALAAVGAGKLGEAREWFAEASAAGGDMGHLATLGHAQAAIALGRHDEALEILGALADSEGVEDPVLGAARFAAANALLDAGEYEAAAEAFGELAAEGSPDASFAAAVARYRTGEREVALESLTELVESCPEPVEGEARRPVTRADRDLDPTAVLQAWVKNYRENSFEDYRTGRLTTMLSVHGCDLAVETLPVFESAPSPPPPAPVVPEPAAPVPAVEAGVVQPAQLAQPVPAEPAGTAATAESTRGRSGLLTILLVVGGLVVLLWLWRRS